jgi:hypothetical protein
MEVERATGNECTSQGLACQNNQSFAEPAIGCLFPKIVDSSKLGPGPAGTPILPPIPDILALNSPRNPVSQLIAKCYHLINSSDFV